ncbi:MAG: hypothetical protein AAGH83_11610 [Pseudomonadota bacterium]
MGDLLGNSDRPSPYAIAMGQTSRRAAPMRAALARYRTIGEDWR